MWKKTGLAYLFRLGFAVVICTLSTGHCIPFKDAEIVDSSTHHAIAPRYTIYANERQIGEAGTLLGPKFMRWTDPVHTFAKGTIIRVTRSYGIVADYNDEWTGILEFDSTPANNVTIRLYDGKKLGVIEGMSEALFVLRK